MRILSKGFYRRDPAIVARGLLGKVLVRRIGSENLSGKIVEVEAYYSKGDPAFRTGFLPRLLSYEPGAAFIYMVHANWLLNIIAYDKVFGGVLIRALEPLGGVERMMRNRCVEDIRELTNAPGRLAKALKITGALNGVDVSDRRSHLIICPLQKAGVKVGSSYRIGVRRDLRRRLRFFIKGSEFVSK
ncbi:MAG: DNA-3-methyladenine glycosylase [Thermoproteota archaeon]